MALSLIMLLHNTHDRPTIQSLEQKDMMLKMNEISAEKLTDWVTYLASEFPSLFPITERVILGSYAWTIPSLKRRIVIRDSAYQFGGGVRTPADIARDYISAKYPKRRLRITTEQYNACIKTDVSAPLHCTPCEIDYAYYVDVRAAYWSIIRAVGWDVSYLPSRYLSQNSDNADFPVPDIKMARNCLVSIGLNGNMNVWDGNKIVWLKKPNKYANMVLWRLVQDVLNGVATEMISIGAVYAYTDGYIIPHDKLELAREIGLSWGLDIGIRREGRVKVIAPATYEFPNFRTKVLPRLAPIKMTKVYDPDIGWLRWRFRKLAERANVATY